MKVSKPMPGIPWAEAVPARHVNYPTPTVAPRAMCGGQGDGCKAVLTNDQCADAQVRLRSTKAARSPACCKRGRALCRRARRPDRGARRARPARRKQMCSLAALSPPRNRPCHPPRAVGQLPGRAQLRPRQRVLLELHSRRRGVAPRGAAVVSGARRKRGPRAPRLPRAPRAPPCVRAALQCGPTYDPMH